MENRRTTSNGRVRHYVCAVVRAIQSGAHGVTRPTAAVRCVLSLPLIFFVSTPPLLGQTPTNAVPALAPPYGEIPPTFWEQHGTLILAGSLTLGALAVLILWKMLQPKPAVILPPDILAREALTKLLRQPEEGKHLSEVSQTLRHYLNTAFELPAAELTTTEFCAALTASKKIGADMAQAISSLLRECDTRKFSPAVRSPAFTRPGPPEGGIPNLLPPLHATNRALELVERGEKRLAELRAQTLAPK